MIFEILKNWEIVIDGVQIFLCLLILFCFFRNRNKKKVKVSMNTGVEFGQDFKSHILTQTIKQQVARAFASVIETIAVEQERLESALQSDHLGNDAGYVSESRLRSKHADSNASCRKSEYTNGKDMRHERMRSLADDGMSSRQISENLKAPLGEVELILSLNSTSN